MVAIETITEPRDTCCDLVELHPLLAVVWGNVSQQDHLSISRLFLVCLAITRCNVIRDACNSLIEMTYLA